jgi:hypothetical protein
VNRERGNLEAPIAKPNIITQKGHYSPAKSGPGASRQLLGKVAEQHFTAENAECAEFRLMILRYLRDDCGAIFLAFPGEASLEQLPRIMSS